MSPHKVIERIKRQSEPRFMDLHLHTTVSDGLLSPEELIRCAYKMKYKILGITDHDSLNGISKARQTAENYGLEIIPGCELTAYFYNNEMHILAYFIEPDNPFFRDHLAEFKEARFIRAKKIVKKLHKMNIKIDFEEMVQHSGSESLGRPHIAREIVLKGYEFDTQLAFKKYLLPGSPAYVQKFMISPRKVIRMILQAGGVPVFAHPYYYFNFEGIIHRLVEYGLKGIEVYHSYHTPELERRFKKIARHYDLIITGGSDAHSGPDGDYLPFGKVALNKNLIKGLRNMRDKIREGSVRSKIAC
ncbi:MAG: PHP domain-containing protein [Spirochaetes bacterium]|nr:PHP domain-containing protein [Spirochaetota bacterium]